MTIVDGTFVDIISDRYSFLPREGDFTIICDQSLTQSCFQVGGSKKRPAQAFVIKSEPLTSKSSLVKDIVDASPNSTTRSIKVEEKAETVALVLSACLEPNHLHLDSCTQWKWLCEAGRTTILLVILAKIADERHGFVFDSYSAGDNPFNVLDVLAEAATHDDACLLLAEATIRCRCEQGSLKIIISPVKLSQLYYMELGHERYSLVIDAMARLLSEGSLRRERK